MQKIQFTAIEVENAPNEYDILMIGFYSENHYFMIQHSDEHDEEDIAAGMDTYHIERDDQSYSGYGGVQQVQLRRNQIQISLNKKGQRTLKCGEVIVDFNVPQDQWDALHDNLVLVFGANTVKSC